MDSIAHPLIGQLKPIFSELHTSKAGTLPSVILKLEYIIEDDSDAFIQGGVGIGAGPHRVSSTRALINWLNSQVEDLFRKPETHLAGVLCVKALLNLNYVDGNETTRFFARLLEACVSSSGPDAAVATAAAEVWGLLLSGGGSVAEGLARERLDGCVRALQSDASPLADRIAACLFLRELFRCAPPATVSRIPPLLEGLRAALRDASAALRAVSADALCDALAVVHTSLDAAAVRRVQETLLADARRGLHAPRRAEQHGAVQCLVAVLAALNADRAAAALLSPAAARDLREAWQLIGAAVAEPAGAAAADARADQLRALTLLAAHDPVGFRERSVSEVVAAVAAAFRAPAAGRDERPAMLLAVARLAPILPDLVHVFVKHMIPHIESALVRHAKGERCLEAVTCLATLAEVNPRAVRPYLRQILGPLFAGPPNAEFAKDIARICVAFPELRSTCLHKILDAIKAQLVCAHHRFAAAGAPDTQGAALTLQSLSALESLDFTGYSTLPFLCDAVVRYTSFPKEEVRRTAINICFKLVLSGCRGAQSPCRETPEGVVEHHGRDHTCLINTVLRKLVNVAVADPESDIRLHTLESLTEAYDETLALQDIVRSLFPALHDKHQNRLAVVRLLGRLSRRNPAHVYPILRRIMVQCATEMQFFENAKKQEQAFYVLGAIVESSSDMGRTYVSSMLASCVARLREPSQHPSVLSALLSCVGKLLRYAEGDDVRMAAEIRPIAVHHVLDSSHLPKRCEALRTLGDIARTTRDVRVFHEHPALLSMLLQALHGGFKEAWPVRNDVLQLMGIIGAIDPMVVKEVLRETRGSRSGTDDTPPPHGLSEEEVIAHTVMRSTLQILSLPSLTDKQCVRGIELVVSLVALEDVSAGALSPQYAGIINSILKHARSTQRLRKQLLIHLTSLVVHMREYARVHLDAITNTIEGFISSSDPEVLEVIFVLLQQLRRFLRDEFRPHLTSLLIPIVSVVQERPEITGENVFEFFSAMGPLLEDHLHNVLVVVCDVIVNASFSNDCRMAAMNTLISFAQQLANFHLHSSRCIHSLCRVLKEAERVRVRSTTSNSNSMNSNKNTSGAVGNVHSLGDMALTALHTIAQNLGSKFEKFMPMVYPVVAEYYAEKDGAYTHFCAMMREAIRSRGRALLPPPEAPRFADDGSGPEQPAPNIRTAHSRGSADRFASLCLVLRTRDRLNEEDWSHWLRYLAVELLRSSPSPSHALAFPLAEIHEPFARQMFHSAFAMCYSEMNEETRKEVVRLLSGVLKGPQVPSEVLQELLNLSEYMERLEIRVNTYRGEGNTSSSTVGLFDLPTLMESSEKCNLYSKALHYVEIKFFETIREYERSVLRGIPRPLPVEAWRGLLQLCEKSIYLCNLLGQRESANGVLKFIQDNFSMLTGQRVTELSQMMDAQMFDKLQWWSQSHRAYEQRIRQEPNKVSNMVGLMKALDALGNYPRVLDMWRLFVGRVNKKEISELAPMGAHAAWLMRRWNDMEHITSYMSSEGYTGTTAIFYRAVLATRRREFHVAERLIKQCRRRLDSTLSALVAESYDRAYGLFVGIQQLSELEELAIAARDPEGASHWQELWEKRLSAMAYEGWSGTLTNHTLLVPPLQELDMWLRFVSLSRANGREHVSNEILRELLGDQSIESAVDNQVPQPAIALASFQHLYETNYKEQAIELLGRYVIKVEDCGMQHVNRDRNDLALCHAKLAEWLAHRRRSPSLASAFPTILQHLRCATELDSKNGSIWHTWARLHHEVAIETGAGKNNTATTTTTTTTTTSTATFPEAATVANITEEHILCAIDGYLRSVYLSQELEDVLGFLSLWFLYGSLPSVQGSSTIKSGIHKVSPTVWLEVIPQIIARIFSQDLVVAESVYHLLVIIAKAHPQALLYNLNVASTSYQGKGSTDSVERKKGAQRVLARISEFHHNGKAMVNDVALACRELVRCAVLWPELWIEELDRAWHIWDKSKNALGVLMTLRPLLQNLRSPETMAESHFAKEFGDVLADACGCAERTLTSGNVSCMDEAFSLFRSALGRMFEQMKGVSSLALQLVSPRLLQNGKNLSIVVPGQYKENDNFPRIASFQSTLRVLASKQRPRRIYINGSDGNLYKFLLKGHEDLRLDERVMQLLGFANKILKKHAVTKCRDCLIQTYSVTPLSDNAGLVGWVDHCDTLHQIIIEYRVHSRYLLTETNLMQSMCDGLSNLTLIQRVEPFEFVLENTEGADLVRSLWMRAPSAEVWLERRTTYVCSLATMSMVGHILGLGDRHPSNLMIHAFSGRVVHIDFGDCFEVAQHRSSHPEKVPFRLTRMLVKAMEIGGIEGLFRHGCMTVMGVLREEGSSLLALLEAFVHDPLVSWWRDEPGESAKKEPPTTTSHSQSLVMRSLLPVLNKIDVGSLHTAQPSILRRSVSSGFMRRHNNAEMSPQQTRKAQSVVNRIKEKLEGRDFLQCRPFRDDDGLTVEKQVSRLIEEATSNENLCVHYYGWCPLW